MSSGELTNILVSTDVTRYLEFKQVAGSYVQQGSGSKATVAKVPSDAAEALRSPLMGIFEKRRMKSFIEWVGQFDLKDSATHKGNKQPPSPVTLAVSAFFAFKLVLSFRVIPGASHLSIEH